MLRFVINSRYPVLERVLIFNSGNRALQGSGSIYYDKHSSAYSYSLLTFYINAPKETVHRVYTVHLHLIRSNITFDRLPRELLLYAATVMGAF